MSFRPSAASAVEPSIPSPRRLGQRNRTLAVPDAGTWVGCTPNRTNTARSWKDQSFPAPSRICRSAASGKQADPTEVVVDGAEAPDVVARFLERGKSRLVEARLDSDDLGRGMETWPIDGFLGGQAFVQDSAQHLDERRTKARPTGGPGGDCEAIVVEDECGGHHAFPPRPGLERAHLQVDLAEHAVQVHVQAREKVTRAEPEARREDAGIAFRVDYDEVRRVADLLAVAAVGRRLEHAREGEDALGRLYPAQRGERR